MGLPASGEKPSAEGVQSSAPTGEKPAEQKTPLASETEGKETKESETAETEGRGADDARKPEETENEETETEIEKDEPEKPKRKSGFQRRVDKLHRERAEARQEADYWKRRAMESAAAPKAPQAPVDTVKPAQDEAEPDPNAFDDHVKYVKAVALWEARKEIRAELKLEAEKRERASRETDAQRIEREHGARITAFREKHDDFDEVLEAGLADCPASPTLEHIIKSSENGPELLYELAKDGKEAARIGRLPAIALAREIGKIEARIASQASQERETPPNKITKAPKPLTPVTARGGKTEKSPDEMDYQEYKKWREGQLKSRRS